MRNIEFEQVNKILNQANITIEDRFQLDSFVVPTLTEFCKDLRSNEIEKALILEENNISRYINSVAIVLGIYGEDTLLKAMSTSPISDVLFELKDNFKGDELIKNTIIIIPKMLLALGHNSGSNMTTPFFEGEMPQKFLSFRNQTANEWFESFVKIKLYILSSIYNKMSLEDTKSHLLANLAYQLNRANPVKYKIDSSLSVNDALTEIVQKFLNDREMSSKIIYSDEGDVLSKVL